MAVAMTASLPMGVHANTVTYPADGNYVYFYKSENNHTSAKETKAFINSIAQKQNSDGSTTVTAYDKVGNTEFILVPLTKDEITLSSKDSNAFWKILEEYGSGKLIPYDSTISKANSSSQKSTGSTSSSAHVHDYAWVRSTDATENTDAVLEYRCRACGDIAAYKSVDNSAYALFLKDAAEEIKDAAANAVVKIDTVKWLSLDKAVVDAFDARKDVTLKITYTQKGERKALEIPAGTDLSSLLDENGYIGFSRLAEHYAVPYVYGKN